MNGEMEQIPILIYYDFRGQAQPVRNFFCYLAIPFMEIHLQHFDEQRRQFPAELLQKIQKFKIDRSQLPSLIHKDLLIEGALPLMTYICKRFNRQDLLGSDMRARARFQQILQIYFLKQPQSMAQLFTMAQFAYKNKSKQAIDHFINKTYESVMASSKYIKQLCQMLDAQQVPKFVLGTITLVDFYFIQTCFYMLGMFYCPERGNFGELRSWDFSKTHFLEKPNAYYLELMNRYLESMKNEPFYAINKEYLQSFLIISQKVNEQKANGLRKVWLGNQKFIM